MNFFPEIPLTMHIEFLLKQGDAHVPYKKGK